MRPSGRGAARPGTCMRMSSGAGVPDPAMRGSWKCARRNRLSIGVVFSPNSGPSQRLQCAQTESGVRGEDQMKKSAFSEVQITHALRQVEMGPQSRRSAGGWASVSRRAPAGSVSSPARALRSCAACASSKRRTASSNHWWPTSPWINTCSRRCSEKSSKASPALGAGAICAGGLPRM
jgi:hypothetical protein